MNLKTSVFRFLVDENILKTGRAFQKPDWVFPKQKSKLAGDCWVFKFLRLVLTETI